MKTLRKFIKNEDGNYAALMALMALPILGSVAIAVDYSNTTRLKAELRNAADAACVPVAKMYLSGDYTDSEVVAKGVDFFTQNFNMNTQFVSDIALSVTLPNATGNTERLLKCEGQLTYNTIFGPALAMLTNSESATYVTVIEESVMRMRNVAEIALVMDASGSMGESTLSGKTRMVLLKEASTKLVEDLFNEGEKITGLADAVRFSVVPFSASVNVGSTYKTASWMDTSGISPIHHENLDWGTMGAANTPWKSLGANGARLDAAGVPLTRFTILDNLKFASGGTESTAPIADSCKVWKAGSGTSSSSASNSNCAVKDRTGTITYLRPGVSTERTTLATQTGLSTTSLANKYTWGGCVESRPYPYNVQDTVPSSSLPASLFVPMFAPDEYNNDRYGATLSSAISGDVAGDANAENNWWPDTHPTNARTITNTSYNYYTSAGSTSTAWELSTGRSRLVDATKYYNETPYLLGSSTSASSTSSSNTRKGQWHYFKSDVGPNRGCTTTPITALTNNEATIKAAISALQPTGNTDVTEGLAWGWRTITSGAPFTEGVADTNRAVDKVIIVMTDGANTYTALNTNTDYSQQKSTYAANGLAGWANNTGSAGLGTQTSASNKPRIVQGTTASSTTHTSSNYSSAMIQQMGSLCSNVKATDRVLLMTVALDLDKNDSTDVAMMNALKDCSGDSRSRKDSGGNALKMYWNACTRTVSDGSCTTLEDTFIQIKEELSNLRFVG
jgi:Flp pilus assembly protein TadG